MLIQPIVFYMFSFFLILGGLLVITSKNPVYSVLFLIFSFFNAAGLFLLLGAEFLAMTLIIVYVGAVAVLFLFVVMMLNIDFSHIKRNLIRYFPFSVAIGGVIVLELALVFMTWYDNPALLKGRFYEDPSVVLTNAQRIGNVLYTDFMYLFLTAGLILLVAMIGAILLTHQQRSLVKKQKIFDQVHRKKEDVIEVQKVQVGKGIA